MPYSDDESDKADYRHLAIYKKADEILKIVFTLADIIDKGKDELMITEQMLSNALIIPAKIAGAEGGDLFSIRFDNATIIKLSARELLAQTSLLFAQKLCDDKYIQLLRDKIEEFRILLLEWVMSFDKENDVEDEWDIRNL